MDEKKIDYEEVFGTLSYLNLSHLFDGKLHTDDGCTFNIHRYALAKNSRYFQALFCDLNKDKKEFLIPGIEGHVLSKILYFLYKESFPLPIGNIADIVIAADYLMLDDAIQNIMDHLTSADCISVFLATKVINDSKIQDGCLKFIITHFEEIIRQHLAEIIELPYEILVEFLQKKDLNISHERSIWTVIVEWVKKDFPERKSHVPDLTRCLAWGDIDEDLAEEIWKHSIITDNPYCSEFELMKRVNYFVDPLNRLRVYLKFDSFFTDNDGFRKSKSRKRAKRKRSQFET